MLWYYLAAFTGSVNHFIHSAVLLTPSLGAINMGSMLIA
jgi:hypothetical protein